MAEQARCERREAEVIHVDPAPRWQPHESASEFAQTCHEGLRLRWLTDIEVVLVFFHR